MHVKLLPSNPDHFNEQYAHDIEREPTPGHDRPRIRLSPRGAVKVHTEAQERALAAAGRADR